MLRISGSRRQATEMASPPGGLYICRSMKLTEQLEGLEFLGSRSSCLDGQMIAASKLKGSP